jgi:hypothetical protein
MCRTNPITGRQAVATIAPAAGRASHAARVPVHATQAHFTRGHIIMIYHFH